MRGETVRDERYVLSFDALIDYLDALQETGRQHLYIFRIPDGQREVLADPQKVKELLKGDDAIYAGGLRIFETAKGQPELVLVKYEPAEAPRYLILKWIETRGEPADGDDEQEEIEDAEEQEATAPEERLDLQTRAMKARNAEQIRFRGIVEKRLGFPLAGPLPLAPAIRSIILTRASSPPGRPRLAMARRREGHRDIAGRAERRAGSGAGSRRHRRPSPLGLHRRRRSGAPPGMKSSGRSSSAPAPTRLPLNRSWRRRLTSSKRATGSRASARCGSFSPTCAAWRGRSARSTSASSNGCASTSCGISASG
ncbi:MAG TPA: hypothetical protein VJZ76_16615 [Thermoanaerobaculia bacterium]|nr:hypothetical protein [Thermoanaerobaculia bacterium]